MAGITLLLGVLAMLVLLLRPAAIVSSIIQILLLALMMVFFTCVWRSTVISWRNLCSGRARGLHCESSESSASASSAARAGPFLERRRCGS